MTWNVAKFPKQKLLKFQQQTGDFHTSKTSSLKVEGWRSKTCFYRGRNVGPFQGLNFQNEYPVPWNLVSLTCFWAVDLWVYQDKLISSLTDFSKNGSNLPAIGMHHAPISSKAVKQVRLTPFRCANVERNAPRCSVKHDKEPSPFKVSFSVWLVE